MIPAGLGDWLDHQPTTVISSYCHAWATSPRLWLKAWQPGERAQVRLVMNRVCRG